MQVKLGLRLCVVIPAVFLGSGFLQVDKKSDDVAWITYSSKQGGFIVLMPNIPKEEVQSYNTSAGKLDGHLATAEMGDIAAFLVSYADFPSIVTDQTAINRILDGARDNFLANQNAKVLNEKSITLGNHLGREIKIETRFGITTTRMYWVTRRLYQLLAMAIDNSASAHADKFLNSFRLEGDVSASLTAPLTWIEFVSELGRFKLLMPSRPTEQLMPLSSSTDSTDLRIYVSLSRDGIAFVAGYSDVPDAPRNQTEIIKTLDGVRNGQLEKVNGKLWTENTISLDGYQGRELKFETPVGLSVGRVFIVGRRIYQILAIIPDSIVHSESAGRDVEKFLSSFKLVALEKKIKEN